MNRAGKRDFLKFLRMVWVMYPRNIPKIDNIDLKFFNLEGGEKLR